MSTPPPPQDRSRDRDIPAGLARPGRVPPPTVSISSLHDHADCPASWAHRRLDRALRPSDKLTGSAAVGNSVHRGLELMAGGATRDEALAPSNDVRLDDESAAEAASLLDGAIAWPPTDPRRNSLVDVEVSLLGEIDGITVAGVADAIEVGDDGVWFTSDYKTGQAPSPVAVDDDGNPIYAASVTRQPTLYAELAESPERHFGRAKVLYPRSQVVVDVNLDDERGKILRIEARRWVAFHTAKLHRSIAKGFFAAKPDPRRCAGCQFASRCPAAALDVASEAA